MLKGEKTDYYGFKTEGCGEEEEGEKTNKKQEICRKSLEGKT